MSFQLPARSLVVAALLFASHLAPAVTISGDPVAHLWHSFQTPDKAFEGAAGYRGGAWNNTDAGAMYAEWGGFVPAARNTWRFTTPTVAFSAGVLAVLNETSGTGLLTGTGNIYGLAFGQVPGPPLVFDLTLEDQRGTVYQTGETRTVVMRSGTKGTLPNMNVTLNGVAANAWINTFRIDATIDMPTGPGGALEPNPASDAEWLWLWEKVPATAIYRFEFRSLIGHMSLDNLAVYASPPIAPPPAAPVPTERVALASTNALASQLAAAAAEETLVAMLATRVRELLASTGTGFSTLALRVAQG